MTGIDSDWTGVGVSQAMRLVTSSKSFDRPSGSNPTLSKSASESDDAEAFVAIRLRSGVGGENEYPQEIENNIIVVTTL
jgi:hypothetical protein